MDVTILIRREIEGRVILTIEVVSASADLRELQEPRHMEKGIRQSPYQKDSFLPRETE